MLRGAIILLERYETLASRGGLVLLKHCDSYLDQISSDPTCRAAAKDGDGRDSQDEANTAGGALPHCPLTLPPLTPPMRLPHPYPAHIPPSSPWPARRDDIAARTATRCAAACRLLPREIVSPDFLSMVCKTPDGLVPPRLLGFLGGEINVLPRAPGNSSRRVIRRGAPRSRNAVDLLEHYEAVDRNHAAVMSTWNATK